MLLEIGVSLKISKIIITETGPHKFKSEVLNLGLR